MVPIGSQFRGVQRWDVDQEAFASFVVFTPLAPAHGPLDIADDHHIGRLLVSVCESRPHGRLTLDKDTHYRGVCPDVLGAPVPLPRTWLKRRSIQTFSCPCRRWISAK